MAADPASVFQLVPDEPEPAPKPAVAQPAANTAVLSLFLLSLKTLSQRALLAITDLFTLATVSLAFALWWNTPDPNINQIVSHSIFAFFVLCANVIVRRK